MWVKGQAKKQPRLPLQGGPFDIFHLLFRNSYIFRCKIAYPSIIGNSEGDWVIPELGVSMLGISLSANLSIAKIPEPGNNCTICVAAVIGEWSHFFGDDNVEISRR